MNNAPRPQPTQPTDPDMALLFLGSLLATLHHAPERDDVKLDALAAHIILDERPKTLLGLAIAARAEKWLRRYLWMVDFDNLPPSDQAARIVIDSAMRMLGSAPFVTDEGNTQILEDAGWMASDDRKECGRRGACSPSALRTSPTLGHATWADKSTGNDFDRMAAPPM